MATDMSQLYTYNPGTANVAPTQQAQAGSAASSNAQGYLSQAKEATASTKDVDQSSLASSQLNDITSQDSPLMQRARQEGMLLAAKRGLQNSSIAAGAAEGAMVDRATPLAQQNASILNTQQLANQTAENEANTLNAQLGTSVSQHNAALQTDVSKQNANNATDVSKFNTGVAEDASKFNADVAAKAAAQDAASANSMREKVTQANADLNRQFLSGEQTMDLASIQGKYQQLLSSNAAAAQLYDSYFQSISQTMANKDIDPSRVAQTVAQQQQMLQAGLSLIQGMSATILGDANAPLSGGTGGGTTQVGTNNPAPPQIPNVTTPEAAPGAQTSAPALANIRNVAGRYGTYLA